MGMKENKKIFKEESGQSLMEILIGLSIGAILIGGASIAVVFMLRSGSTLKFLNAATNFTQDILNKAESYGNSNWFSFYNLGRSSSSPYFIVSSSTSGLIAVGGKEAIIDKEVKDNLILRFGFDESTGTVVYDYSGNGNNGSLANGTVRNTDGQFMGVVTFDGVDDYVTNESVNPWGGDFTINLWVKTSRDDYDVFVGREVYTVNGFRFGIHPPWKLTFWTAESGGGGTISSPDNSLSANIWQNVAVVRSTSSVKLYINGAKKAEGSVNIVTPSAGVQIGGGNLGQPMIGSIDEVRIFNRALSDEEIKKIYEGNFYSRYFYIEDVCRSESGTSSIVGTAPCSGSFNDFATKKITAVTEWIADNKKSNFTLSKYITRWFNYIFNQTDWSGGASSGAVYSSPPNQFSSSSNITTTPFGSFQIQNLTQY